MAAAIKPYTAYRPFGWLRFLLALMVVFSHSWGVAGLSSDHPIAQAGIGNPAVMGFFAISGYVIGEAADVFYTGRPVAFFANRVLRILVPYWAALALTAGSVAYLISTGQGGLLELPHDPSVVFTARNIIANLIHVFPGTGMPDAVYLVTVWAVVTEMGFYGVMFLLMAVDRLGVGLTGRHLAILGFGGTLLLHVVHEYVRPIHTELAHVPLFSFGFALYHWQKSGRALDRAGVLIAAALVGLYFIRYVQGHIPVRPGWLDGLSHPPYLAAVLLLGGILALLPVLGRRDRCSRPLVAIDRWLGDLSYPIYLIHFTVVVFVGTLWQEREPAAQAVIVVGTVSVALMMKVVVERPLAVLRNRIRGVSLGAGLRSSN